MTSLPGAMVVPLGLGGDSVTNNNAAIAVVSVVSIVGGYMLLFALWWFVFRRRRWDEKTQPHPDQAAAARGTAGAAGSVDATAFELQPYGYGQARDDDGEDEHADTVADGDQTERPPSHREPSDHGAASDGRGHQPGQPGQPGQPSQPGEVPAAGPDARQRHGGPMQIERHIGSRFRRR